MGRPLYNYIINKIRCTAKVDDGEAKSLTLAKQIGKARFVATDGANEYVVNLVAKADFEAEPKLGEGFVSAKINGEDCSVNFITQKLVFANELDEPGLFVYDLVYDTDGTVAGISVSADSEVTLGGIPAEIAPSADGKVSINDPEADVLLNNAVVSKTSTMTVKSAELNNVKFSSPQETGNGLLIAADETVLINDSELSLNTTKSSNVVCVKNAKSLTLKETKFTGQNYNTIMTGQKTETFLDNMVMDGCDFSESSHVTMWFGGWNDNAVLTIKNCHIKSCQQLIEFGDYHNAANKLTVNLENVVIDEYEKGTEETPDIYEGIMLFDDRVCATVEELKSLNPFGCITINLKNVTAGGKKLTKDNFVMGSGVPGQMAYMYNAKTKANVPFDASTKDIFPTINVL